MSEELNLEQAKAFIETLRSEGACHIAAATDDRLIAGAAHHLPGPDPECIHCDDVFGPASMLSELVTEIERLRAVLGSRGAHEVCPHCKLPRVLPEVCTPAIHAVIQEMVEMDGKMFYAGMEHEAKHHIIQSAALRDVGTPQEKEPK